MYRRTSTRATRLIAAANPYQSAMRIGQMIRKVLRRNPKTGPTYSSTVRSVFSPASRISSLVEQYASFWHSNHLVNQALRSVAMIPSVMLYNMNPGVGSATELSAKMCPARRGKYSNGECTRRPKALRTASAPSSVTIPRASILKGLHVFRLVMRGMVVLRRMAGTRARRIRRKLG